MVIDHIHEEKKRIQECHQAANTLVFVFDAI